MHQLEANETDRRLVGSYEHNKMFASGAELHKHVHTHRKRWEAVIPGSKGAHLPLRSRPLNSISHQKEPGNLGEIADCTTGAEKLQEMLRVSYCAKREGRAQKRMGTCQNNTGDDLENQIRGHSSIKMNES